MLETAAKEDNEWSTALAKLEEELKPLRERIEYVSNLSKPESLPASSELDSCESLRRKIEKLEVYHLKPTKKRDCIRFKHLFLIYKG